MLSLFLWRDIPTVLAQRRPGSGWHVGRPRALPGRQHSQLAKLWDQFCRK